MCMCYLDFVSVPYKIYVCDKNNLRPFHGGGIGDGSVGKCLPCKCKELGLIPQSMHACMCVYTYVCVYITFINNNINILFF